jgi:hypothetical protein
MADAGKRPVRLGMRGPRLNRCAMELAGSQPESGGVASRPDSGSDREPGELLMMRPQPESGGGASQPESGGANTSSRKRPSPDSTELPAPASQKALTSKQKASRERARVYQAKKTADARGETVDTEVMKRRAPGTIISLALVAFIGERLKACRRFKSFNEISEAWFQGGMPEKVAVENSDEAYDDVELVRASSTSAVSCVDLLGLAERPSHEPQQAHVS